MMELKHLLRSNDKLKNQAHGEWVIKGITDDSRRVKDGYMFVALKGSQFDGNAFIRDAMNAGASVIVTDQPTHLMGGDKLEIIKVDHAVQFLRDAVTHFYGHPSTKIKIMGVTGTNGKTTTCYLVEAILQAAGLPSAILGTINYRIGKDVFPSTTTTPGFVDNQELLAKAVRAHISYCMMEVSSHALDQGRVDRIDFKAAAFTNLTMDHLDYHESIEDYFEAKTKLFTGLSKEATAVINADDPFGQELIPLTPAYVLSYGLSAQAHLWAEDVKLTIEGVEFALHYPQGHALIRSTLIGQHNVYNILAAAGLCLSQGISIDHIVEGIKQLACVPGRLEAVPNKRGCSIFIDYAHTPDALSNVLSTLRETTTARIILVFGCGGDRDRGKRPVMAGVASELADFTVVTSDNPRTEDPQAIIDEIVPGFKNNAYKIIIDRREAIQAALSAAGKGDVVLIAGKGHEMYQIFGKERFAFDERQVIQSCV